SDMFRSASALIVVLLVASVLGNSTPQSIKISLTEDQASMQVTWYTDSEGSSPVVQFDSKGFDPSSLSASLIQAKTVEFTEKLWSGYTNYATISQLSANTVYYYAVGDQKTGVWSELFNFTTGAMSADVVPFNFVTYGDMGEGVDNSTVHNVINRLDSLQMVLHVGDIAYADLQSGNEGKYGNQTTWNMFLEEITPIATRIPYMVCPGNHDIFDGVSSNYQNSFMMPQGSSGGNWYSFDYNGVHFVGISSETDYSSTSPQIAWLESELKSFRKANPTGWLIAFSHRPYYCSSDFGWCKDDQSRYALQKTVEPLFYQYNVDLFIAGHSHEYERFLPAYQNEVAGTYEDPKGPVSIVIGTAGCQEGLNPSFQEPAPSISSGVRLLTTGFGQVSVINSTHIQWQFIKDNTNEILDDIYFTKGTF
ncbi:hypothetical protein SAMD00019534_010390, partial [Acytostelium subglobosum LB1]|uniref:hypothetical protein n=1 Tax=Acytostelium subglobosum LB1 TaxID=1410327 RepID=UPI000645031E